MSFDLDKDFKKELEDEFLVRIVLYVRNKLLRIDLNIVLDYLVVIFMKI